MPRTRIHSPKQQQAVKSEFPITALITGIQWGKTTSGSLWLRRRVTKFIDKPGANFIVTAPTYKIMEQSTLPAFKKEFDGFGEFSSAKAAFEIHSGYGERNQKIFFRTATDPDSIVGITDVEGIWGDEAGKYPLYFWENMQARAAFRNCPIMLTTSPYSMNWIYKDIMKPVKAGHRKDVLLIQASSDENPFFPKDVFEQRKLTMDPRRFNMMYNGNFDKMQGLVYDCFDDHENQCDAFKLPDGTKYYGGIDWGHTEPFVIKVRAVTPGGQHYGVSEFYKSGLTPSDIVAIAKQKKDVFNIKQFYCGPDQPGLIEELNRNKVSAIAASNDVARGVGLHYELLRSRRLKYFRNQNPHTIDELETYHYPEPKDLKPDEAAKDMKPVGQNDHALDADRYVTISTYTLGQEKHGARVPEDNRTQETNQQRIQRLMKRKVSGQTESWE